MSSESIRTEPAEAGTPEVQEALDKLRALQDVLHKKHEIESKIEELPRELATKNELLNRLRLTYVERNEDQEATAERIKTLRDDAAETERLREQYEGQMDQIRTQREYEALDKQIRDAADREMDYRRSLQEEEERLEQVSTELAGEAELIGQQEQLVKEEESRIQAELVVHEKDLTRLLKQETEISAGLDEELLFKFERIVRSTGGYGIVPLQAQVCTGCYMTLPAHFVNRVRRAEDVLFCTHGRIVFYGDVPTEEDADPQMEVFDDEPGFFSDADVDDELEEEEELFLDLELDTSEGDEDGEDDEDHVADEDDVTGVDDEADEDDEAGETDEDDEDDHPDEEEEDDPE